MGTSEKAGGWPVSVENERRWTTPRDDCPNPQWWHATDSDSTELEVTDLVEGFIRALQPELVIETGSAWGQTTRAIGQALMENRHGRCISYEVDPQRVSAATQRTRNFPVHIHWMSSIEGIRLLEDNSVSFAWLDSLFELRPMELELIRPKLTTGAVVGIHDTGPHHPLWATLTGHLHKWRHLRLPTPRGVTFLQEAS